MAHSKVKEVSADAGPFAKLDGQRDRIRTTSIQRVLVQWLISKYGLSYKKVKHDILKKMLIGIIDKDDLLDLGAPCEDITKEFSIGFNDAVRRAKAAAGLFAF